MHNTNETDKIGENHIAMSLNLWAAYTSFLIVYMSVPGPSHLLMASNAIGSGFTRALACAAGDLSANTVQILIAGLGIGLAATYGSLLLAVKAAGIAYLVYIAIQMLLRARRSGLANEAPKSPLSLYIQGFMASIINPKAIIFFSSLMPQFVDSAAPIAQQLAILGATYIVVDGTFLTLYGKGAEGLARRIGTRSNLVRYAPPLMIFATAIILAIRVIIYDLGL